MTSKQRSYLMSLAQSMTPIINIGKAGITPELCLSVEEALAKRELIKIGFLKNCLDDHNEAANTLAERTRSHVVQIIGNKLVLYKQASSEKNRKIVL